MKRAKMLTILAVLAGAQMATQAMADGVTLTMGRLSAPYHIDTPMPIRTIKIGDPKVVDVQVMNDRDVVFQPVGTGKTNVLFFDDQGRLLRDLDVSVGGAADIQVMKFGPRESQEVIYRCTDKACEFVGAGSLHLPLQDPRTTTIISTQPPPLPGGVQIAPEPARTIQR